MSNHRQTWVRWSIANLALASTVFAGLAAAGALVEALNGTAEGSLADGFAYAVVLGEPLTLFTAAMYLAVVAGVRDAMSARALRAFAVLLSPIAFVIVISGYVSDSETLRATRYIPLILVFSYGALLRLPTERTPRIVVWRSVLYAVAGLGFGYLLAMVGDKIAS